MSEETKITKTSVEEQLKNISSKELGQMLDKMDVGQEVTADYLELEDGEVVKAVVIAKTTFTTDEVDDNGNPIIKPASVIRTSEGTYITANTVLVRALHRLPLFSAVQITRTGKVKTAGGRTYINYSVQTLVSR